jgi:hypothetical protein
MSRGMLVGERGGMQRIGEESTGMQSKQSPLLEGTAVQIKLGVTLRRGAFSLWEKVAEGRMSNFRQHDCLVSKKDLRERSPAVGAVCDRAVIDRAYSQRPLPRCPWEGLFASPHPAFGHPLPEGEGPRENRTS